MTAPEPDEDPPGVHSKLYGLRVGGPREVAANSVVVYRAINNDRASGELVIATHCFPEDQSTKGPEGHDTCSTHSASLIRTFW